MVTYFYKFLIGEFQAGMDAEAAGAVFSNLLADPLQMSFWMILTVILGFFVCSRGLQNGLEKISKVMMSALLGLIVILAVHSFTLSGAGEGVRFYLIPNMETVREVGIGNVVSAAMNQAFFTLSLGVSAIEIFGSYLGDRYDIQFFLNTYNFVNQENGGISDDTYILRPEEVQGGQSSVNTQTIPTNLTDAYNRIRGKEYYATQRY